MIEINLIKTQVPTQIDLPEKKSNYKFSFMLLASGALLFLLLFAGVYFVFIRTNKKAVIVKKSAITKKHAAHKKEKADNIVKSLPKEKNVIKVSKETNKKPKKTTIKQSLKNKETIKKLENKVVPVFSINIKMENIPKPIKKTEQNTYYNELFAKENIDNQSLLSSTDKTKNVTAQNQYFNARITTRSAYRLKKILKKMNIKYTIKKFIRKTIKTYDIFVGGFDSYPKVAKFAKDLKKKGYSLYKIDNIDLLFYVCIDKNTDEITKNRYMSVWSKTPFRILTKQHKKARYAYIFIFRCTKKQFNILKKKGYYPIISKPIKIGA